LVAGRIVGTGQHKKIPLVIGRRGCGDCQKQDSNRCHDAMQIGLHSVLLKMFSAGSLKNACVSRLIAGKGTGGNELLCTPDLFVRRIVRDDLRADGMWRGRESYKPGN
jgi:hypothetical protein